MPFTVPDLKYAFDALEPHIDAQTMQIHHDKHHGAYVTNANKALESAPNLANASVEELLANAVLQGPGKHSYGNPQQCRRTRQPQPVLGNPGPESWWRARRVAGPGDQQHLYQLCKFQGEVFSGCNHSLWIRLGVACGVRRKAGALHRQPTRTRRSCKGTCRYSDWMSGSTPTI